MTTQMPLLNEPHTLRRLVDDLQTRLERYASLPADQLDALVEASFRLAVHPGTDPATALDLLARAHRLDPANPKHPYHAGLIYLRYGMAAAAHEWFCAAVGLAPVSHRLWAHISLALRGMNDQQPAGASDAVDLPRRIEQITTAVRSGRDDLTPGAAPPRLRPGECRWSGIVDITLEARLRGKTNTRTRDQIVGDLTEVANSSSRRRGGMAAFTVLAVEWMLCGYPAATVRRLADCLPHEDGPASKLLSTVCDLFEAEEAELPSLLADCLARGALPEPLVALIHHRRLFSRPLRVPDLAAYAAARDSTGGDESIHLTAMTRALRALCASPSAPMADVGTSTGSESSVAHSGPIELLDHIETCARQFTELHAEVREYVADLAKMSATDAVVRARIAADCRALTDVIDRLEKQRQSQLAEMRQLESIDAARVEIPFDEFSRRKLACDSALTEPVNFKSNLKKAMRKAGSEQAQGDAVPSTKVRSFQQALEAFGPVHSNDPEPEELSAGPDVATGVAMVDRALEHNFSLARLTLDAYPPPLRNRQAVLLLRRFLDGQQAEIFHRMGHRKAALGLWNRMLVDAPYDRAVLRNLAVAHSSAGQVGLATRAWSRYLESLYVHAVLSGDSREDALARAELHRILAGSFGNASLVVLPSDEEARNQGAKDLPPVLSSSAKVSTATAHLRLEELNRSLSYRSPSLRLGVARTVSAEALAAARDRRLALATAACEVLRPHIAASFGALCLDSIEAAYQTASSASNRTRKDSDEEEEETYAEWAKQRVLWKFRIRRIITGDDADWPLTDYSGDLIGNLRFIDEIALDPLDDFMIRAAQQLGVQQDPARWLEALNQLSDYACGFALDQIFEAAQGDSDAFSDRYHRIARSWARNPIPEKYAHELDDPFHLYGPSAESALTLVNTERGKLSEADRKVIAAAIPAMQRWVVRLPGSSGPVRVLARLLSALDRHEEAAQVLTSARRIALTDRAKRELDFSLAVSSFDLEQYRGAVAILESLLADGPPDDRLRQLLTAAYQGWIKSGTDLPDIQQIRADLAHWDDDETLRFRRRLVADTVVARHRARPGGVRPALLAEELRELCRADPQDNEARFHLVYALLERALEIREQMRSTSGADRRGLSVLLTEARNECAVEARIALEDSALSTEQRKALTELLPQVDPD